MLDSKKTNGVYTKTILPCNTKARFGTCLRKRDFPDELLHSIEDDGFKAIVAEVNECIFFMHSFGSNNWERVAYEPRVTGRDAKIPALDEETPTLLLILGVDTTTGQLKCIRDIMLRGKIVKELHELSRKHLADESISGDFLLIVFALRLRNIVQPRK